jgi:eukaryotic-like serine/threonine-protein kinase
VGSEGERARTTDKEGPKACPSCQARYPADSHFCPVDGAPLTTSARAAAGDAAGDPHLGRQVLGHIEIRQLVGIGAMGRVYRAFQHGIDRDVAVKILHRELSTNETLVARFNREAKVASRLAHPNVVQILLVGQLPDGAMYIVMEYLAGLSLQSALGAAGGAIPLSRALHVALQMCEAAGEAHAQGIVHRDLKPDNVMLAHLADDPDFVKVLDFGIARVNWGELSMQTAPGLIFGTPRYISPEGARGERVGPPGDVYSIATTVYQMLSGRTPFEAPSAADLLEQQIHREPPPIHRMTRTAHLPARVADVIMQNLSKAVSDRAPDARAFGRALRESASMSGLGARDVFEPRSFPAGGDAMQASKAETAKWSPPELAPATRVARPLAGVPNPETGRDPAGEVVRPVENVLGAELVGEVGETRSSARRAAVLVVAALAAGGLVVGLWASRVSPSSGLASVAETPAQSLEAPLQRVRSAGETSWETKARSTAASLTEPDSAPPPTGASTGTSSSGAPGSTPRAVLDVSNPRPGLGQPVDLSARVVVATGAPYPRWDYARFRILGPGLVSGRDLPTSDDGSGVFRSTFTFLQAGRFEVDFGARGPGGGVRAGRAVVVSDLPSAP